MDEENSLRGYSLTLDPVLRRPIHGCGRRVRSARTHAASNAFVARFDHRAAAGRAIRRLQGHWRDEVAEPLLRAPQRQLAEIDKRNKFYRDYETRIVRAIRAELADDQRRTRAQHAGRSWTARLTFALFGCCFSACSRFCSTLIARVSIASWKKSARRPRFCSARSAAKRVPLPHCEVGSAYLSASSHLAVGGDVFDIYRISDNLALLLIADVSGKGVDAAVLTAFIKFTIRGDRAAPPRSGRDTRRVQHRIFAGGREPVSVRLDVRRSARYARRCELRYASAGHDSAFIRRSGSVQQLPVTGPVLGVMDEPFETRTNQLGARRYFSCWRPTA